MISPSGSTLTAAGIRERTETVLVNRFATLATVEQALAAFGTDRQFRRARARRRGHDV